MGERRAKKNSSLKGIERLMEKTYAELVDFIGETYISYIKPFRLRNK